MPGTKISAPRQLRVDDHVDFNSKRITGLADPVSGQDAATKNYVDNAVQGLDIKQSCRAATTGAITLSGTQTIDGISLTAGQRVLVKNQADPIQNGIYAVASGAWTRAADLSAGMNAAGIFTFIEEGTANANMGFVCTSSLAASTVGTHALNFSQFSGAGQIDAGAGLTKTGNQINVVTASSARIVVNADNIDLATAGTAGTYTKVTTDAYGRVISGTSITASDLPSSIDAAKIANGTVSNTEFQYLDGVTSAIQTQFSNKQDLHAQLTALAALATTGLIARTASNTVVTRSIDGTAGRVQVNNANGVSGNPTIDLLASGVSAGTYTKVTVDTYGRVTSGASIAAGDLPSGIDAAKIGSGTVSNTVFGYLAGVTGAIQTQIDAKISKGSFYVREELTGTINGSNTVFYLSGTPMSGKEMVFLNGIMQNAGAGNDYTISGSTVTFATAPIAGDIILATYFT